MFYKKIMAFHQVKALIFVLLFALMLLFPAQVCSALEPVASDDMVSTFEELTKWLESHRKSGGTVRLENDIVVEKNESYMFVGWIGDPTLYIDTGEYTIYVRGMVELYPVLDIYGKGGEKGIFHVEQGGHLDLFSATKEEGLHESFVSVSAKEGYAVYQEEGAFLGVYTNKIIGQIHYAQKPVAWPFSGIADFYGTIEDFPVVVLPLKDEIDTTVFPQTISSYFCENGLNQQKLELPITWNFDAFEEQFAKQERFILTGTYTDDIVAKTTPACLVAFQREGCAVFLQCAASKNEEQQKLTIRLYAKLDDPSMKHRLEWSVDGENWKWEEEENMVWWDESDGVVKYEGVFMDMPELPNYFSVAVTDEKGHTTYSDTIKLTGDDKVAGWDNGGGRNGETTPGDPENSELPPINFPPPTNSSDESTPKEEAVSPEETAFSEEAVSPEETAFPEEAADPPENMGNGNTDREGQTSGRKDQESILKEKKKEDLKYQKDKTKTKKKDSVTNFKAPSKSANSSKFVESESIQSDEENKSQPVTKNPPLAETSVKLPPVGQSQPSQKTDVVLGEEHSFKKGTIGFPVMPRLSQPTTAFDTKTSQTAVAVTIIVLIGVPVYLTPVWKLLWKRFQLHKRRNK